MLLHAFKRISPTYHKDVVSGAKQSGAAGVFYVVTGIHGGHVLVGLLLLLLYSIQLHT